MYKWFKKFTHEVAPKWLKVPHMMVQSIQEICFYSIFVIENMGIDIYYDVFGTNLFFWFLTQEISLKKGR